MAAPVPPSANVSNAASALELAKIHLGGGWLEVSLADVVFAVLKGGASSMVCTLEDKSGKVPAADSKLLVRVYAGGKLYDPENDTIGRLCEAAQAVLAFKLGEL